MSANVYQLVTDRIVSQLEQGVIPWEKPWQGVRSGAYNRISKKSYSLLNQMLLKHQGEYATFKQWADLGGKVRKGAKSEIVVFWKMFPIEETDKDGQRIIKQIPLLKYYNVFHISDVDGVEPLTKDQLNEIEPLEQAEQIMSDYLNRENITLEQSASDKAYYSPTQDLVHLPLMEQFKNQAEYYSTAFHELTHSTGHKTRLDRLDAGLKSASFGSSEYSKEELVAELGSAYILNSLGIETTHSLRNSAAYIQSWLTVLKSDIKFIVSASSKAEKAVNYIIGVEA